MTNSDPRFSAATEDDRKYVGSASDAKAALIEKSQAWRQTRQPSMATAEEHRKADKQEHQIRFELANAALLWLWHEENPLVPDAAQSSQVTDEGHDKPCYYCGEPCSSFAGDPGMWPIALCHKDDPGRVKWHHTRCVSERLIENQPPHPRLSAGNAAVKEACDRVLGEIADLQGEHEVMAGPFEPAKWKLDVWVTDLQTIVQAALSASEPQGVRDDSWVLDTVKELQDVLIAKYSKGDVWRNDYARQISLAIGRFYYTGPTLSRPDLARGGE